MFNLYFVKQIPARVFIAAANRDKILLGFVLEFPFVNVNQVNQFE